MPAIELVDITKRFPGVLANDQVTMTVQHGEVHCLLGENGAGKSTLISILSGMLRPDSGSIRLDGAEAGIRSPRDALRLGIVQSRAGRNADAFATVLESDQRVWDAFNVGSGSPVTVREVAQVLARLLHKNIAPEIMNKYRVGDIRHCFADIGKIRRVFGFQPRRSFETGMAELIRWVATARAPVNRSQQSLAELQKSGLVV